METGKPFTLTREKHLDHMVKVVPFIVLGYAIQCYVIFQIHPGPFSTTGLGILAGLLILMIGSFICYDLQHRVEFREENIRVSFGPWRKTISYSDIEEVLIADPGQSFSSLTLKCQNGKHTFYFVDHAEKIKAWIEHQNKSLPMAA